MTQPAITVGAGDSRRALAAFAHQLDGTPQGIAAVLAEAHAAERSLELILAILHVAEQLLPRLRTEEGRQFLQAEIATAAAAEGAENDH